MTMQQFIVPPSVPRRGNRFSHWLCTRIHRAAGWRVEGELPDVPKMVIVAAPHTSNWDFVTGMLGVVFGHGVRAQWLGKHTLFRPATGWLMRWLGGIPIERNAAHGVVSESIKVMNRAEQLLLVVTPEGTRKKVARWKTGFYHIAVGANVPIVLGALDFGRRRIVFGPVFTPSGDMERDIADIQAHYRQFTGRNPELA